MADLVLERLAKTYPGGVRAVDGLDLAVADGELVALLGPSGSGKTTTLRLVAGLETPTSGTVRIGGRDARGLEPPQRGVAVVFQDHALYPHLTVRGNWAFALRRQRPGRAEVARRIGETAALLGLDPLLDRLPRALSGGERQRAALGRAIVVEPSCCLLDEPLSDLEAPLRAALRADLKTLLRRVGATALLVTHDQALALGFGDRVAVMDRGRVRQVGTPDDVYRRPADRFVAGFVGTPPMGFVEGRAVGSWFDDGHGLRVQLRRPVPAGPVTLGVRPQALRPAADGIEARVLVCEPAGDVTDVRLVTPGGALLTARLRGAAPAPGETVRFGIDPEGVRLFEAGEEGRAL